MPSKLFQVQFAPFDVKSRFCSCISCVHSLFSDWIIWTSGRSGVGLCRGHLPRKRKLVSPCLIEYVHLCMLVRWQVTFSAYAAQIRWFCSKETAKWCDGMYSQQPFSENVTSISRACMLSTSAVTKTSCGKLFGGSPGTVKAAIVRQDNCLAFPFGNKPCSTPLRRYKERKYVPRAISSILVL